MTKATFYWWMTMCGVWLLVYVMVRRLSSDGILAVDAATLLGMVMNWAESTFQRKSS